jgi:methylmalonyl-CoA/ethylmalonyl-CoA epimerase
MIAGLKNYELDHIGIAVRSLDEGYQFYAALGADKGPVEEVESEKVRVMMFELKNKARIELLEAMSEDSPIAKFVAKRGPGIHHICLRVSDLRATLKDLKARKVRLIHEEPRPGAHNCLIAFVHPASAGGVLVELSEQQK